MRLPRLSGLGTLLVTLAILPLTLTCSDDESLAPEAQPLFGNWDATAFLVDGFDVVADGADIFVAFYDDGRYHFSAQGDTSGVLCQGPPNCSEGGNYEAVGASVVLDPGTPDELSLRFSVSVDRLTLSGSIGGTPVSATFVKGS
jgi:hypothetical protein